MDTDEEVEIITDKEIKCEIEEDRSRRHHLDGNMNLIGSKKRQCTSSLLNIYNAKNKRFKRTQPNSTKTISVSSTTVIYFHFYTIICFFNQFQSICNAMFNQWSMFMYALTQQYLIKFKYINLHLFSVVLDWQISSDICSVISVLIESRMWL